MRTNGRTVSIFVNESALKAWLASAAPVARPTRPATVRSQLATAIRASESKAEKG
jgi:hypothetical protein